MGHEETFFVLILVREKIPFTEMTDINVYLQLIWHAVFIDQSLISLVPWILTLRSASALDALIIGKCHCPYWISISIPTNSTVNRLISTELHLAFHTETVTHTERRNDISEHFGQWRLSLYSNTNNFLLTMLIKSIKQTIWNLKKEMTHTHTCAQVYIYIKRNKYK